MFKNILIIVLFLIIILLQTSLGVEEEFTKVNVVTIEYDCKKLQEYINVPEEVIKECNLRLKNE